MLYRVELRGDAFVALYSDLEWAEPYLTTTVFEIVCFRGEARLGLHDSRDLGLGKKIGHERLKLSPKRGHVWRDGEWVKKSKRTLARSGGQPGNGILTDNGVVEPA